MQIYFISLVTFPNNPSGMGMTLLVRHAYCINVKKVTICVLKLVVADCCLVSVSVANGVSLVNIKSVAFFNNR